MCSWGDQGRVPQVSNMSQVRPGCNRDPSPKEHHKLHLNASLRYMSVGGLSGVRIVDARKCGSVRRL